MSKHTVGGFAALLTLVAAIAMPIRAQDPPGVAKTVPAEVAAPRDAAASAEPAIEPEAADAVVAKPAAPTSKPSASTLAAPPAAANMGRQSS